MILNAFTHNFRNVHPHPIHISANFLNTNVVGPCVIESETLDKNLVTKEN